MLIGLVVSDTLPNLPRTHSRWHNQEKLGAIDTAGCCRWSLQTLVTSCLVSIITQWHTDNQNMTPPPVIDCKQWQIHCPKELDVSYRSITVTHLKCWRKDIHVPANTCTCRTIILTALCMISENTYRCTCIKASAVNHNLLTVENQCFYHHPCCAFHSFWHYYQSSLPFIFFRPYRLICMLTEHAWRTIKDLYGCFSFTMHIFTTGLGCDIIARSERCSPGIP